MGTEPHPIILLTSCIYLFISAISISKHKVKKNAEEFRVEKTLGFKQGSRPSAARYQQSSAQVSTATGTAVIHPTPGSGPSPTGKLNSVNMNCETTD